METMYTVYILVTILTAGFVLSASGHDTLTFKLLNRVEALEKEGEKLKLADEVQKRITTEMQNELRLQAQRLTDQSAELEKQQHKLEQQTNTIKKQTTQLDQLSTLLLKQQDELNKQHTKLKNRDNEILHLEAEVKQQKTQLNNVTNRMQTLESEIDNGKFKNKDNLQEKNVPMIDDNAGAQPSELTRQSRLVLEESSAVAFHARIDKGVVDHIGINQKIVYDVVTTNIGAGYHNLHGIFIAPTSGIYIFSTTIMSESEHHGAFNAAIVKNDILLAAVGAYTVDNGYTADGSVTVVTQLSAGDEVWVKLTWPADAKIRGDAFTSFTGCLIMPL